MIKLIGWVTVIALGLHFGIIQIALAFIGMAFITVGSALAGLV